MELPSTFNDELMNLIKAKGKRAWANDNVSEFIRTDEDRNKLIDGATQAFEQVLDSLLIDWKTDPNSQGTPRRLAKMYFNEIMSGRYDPPPRVAAFPNDDADARYDGMLVSRTEINSVCSHHHQSVTGLCFIGIIPGDRVIGLSKYIRIAQWVARRGTLQEQLSMEIAKEIIAATGSQDVGVYIHARHGCCENRGVMAHNSMTQTTVLHGKFKDSLSTKQEFTDNIKMQLSLLRE